MSIESLLAILAVGLGIAGIVYVQNHGGATQLLTDGWNAFWNGPAIVSAGR